MIETKLIDWLTDENIPVYAEMPENPNAVNNGEFYIIEKNGSTVENQIETAQISIRSYAKSMLRAAEMNQEIKTKMREFRDQMNVGRVHLASDYNYTDAVNRFYRYNAIFEITYMEG